MFRLFLRTIFFTALFLLSSGICLATDAQITTQWDVYSADVLIQNGQTVLYFGGWNTVQEQAWDTSGQSPHDTIYRAVCNSPTDCPNPQPVIIPQNCGMNLLNDPTIIDTGMGYYIMYMTGVAAPGTQSAFVTANNGVYFSTSWTNDGVNWSCPQPVLPGDWLPSATVAADGDIWVYANSNVNGQLYRYNLTTSGVNPDSGTFVKYFDPNGNETSSFYVNVDVTWMPQISLYQMLGQTSDEQSIDYLYSADGVNFTQAVQGVVTAPPGQFIVTPEAYPSTYCDIYYGLGPDQYHFNVYFHSWC